jgi:hypothetical protein
MGITYDHIRTPDMECEKCGTPLSGFQSITGPCELLTLDYWQVDEFHTRCLCGMDYSFKIRPNMRMPLPLGAYVRDTVYPS